MNIAREMISHSEVQTSYKVRVASFNQKMKTWEPGRVICSKYFNVEGVKLRIVLYPNGTSKGQRNQRVKKKKKPFGAECMIRSQMRPMLTY